MPLLLSTLPQDESGDRWRFFRDVLMFQAKLFLSNLRDIALMPASLVAALIDLVLRGEREGARFYKVLQWAAHSEEVIGVYSAIEAGAPGTMSVNPKYTVAALISRLEGVLVRECEKGGTAATVKAAMDRAFDQIQLEKNGGAERAREMVARARLSMQDRFGSGDREKE